MRRLVLVCALSASAALPPNAALLNAESRAASLPIDIDNFGEINPGYFRGGQPEGRDYADLAASGVKTVIDLQKDFEAGEQRMVEKAGMKFFRIPMTTRVAPTAQQIAVFLSIVNDPANQPVYVHCAGGRHRTGVMTAVYRMTNDGWTPEQAFKEMKKYDFGWDFLHPEFKRFVYAYRVEPHRAAAHEDVIATAATVN